ncbi:MAG: HNH endonuclease [Bacteroidetes bacterium]|nr:HNH endonuclease [Bacteroidota bacterium]
MVKSFPGERWKEVQFDFDFSNDYRLEVSNFGRLRSFNRDSDGDILKGSSINGYRIVRLKFFTPRDPKTETRLKNLKKQADKLSAKLKQQIAGKENKRVIKETTDLLESFKSDLHKKFMDDVKGRTIHYHALVHRLVAEYFLLKHRPDQTVVAHIDFNKLNNRADNLKWMSPEENYKHQQKSPSVIKEKKARRKNVRPNPKVAKLSFEKVVQLKKLLKQGKPVKSLVKQFKVSDMQIYRIKRGENWSHVKVTD